MIQKLFGKTFRMLTVGLVAGAMLIGYSQTVRAQASVTVDVDIDLPSILILFCFDEIDVTISAANLATLLTGVASTGEATVNTALGAVTPVVSGTTLEGTPVVLDTALTVDPSAVFLNLLGVCGVRALGAGNGVDVSVAGVNLTLDGPGTSQITVDAVATRDNAVGGAFGPTFNIVEANLGLGNVRLIDAQLELDLSSAQEAGTHSSGTAGTFTITAVAP